MFEWDEDEARWTAMHHPFTRADPEWEDGSTRTRARDRAAYDLVGNGNELGGGSFRIHEADLQAAVFGV